MDTHTHTHNTHIYTHIHKYTNTSHTHTHTQTHNTHIHTHNTHTHIHTHKHTPALYYIQYMGHMNLQVRKGQNNKIMQPMHTLLTDNGHGTAAWKPEDPLHLLQQHNIDHICDLRCGQ